MRFSPALSQKPAPVLMQHPKRRDIVLCPQQGAQSHHSPCRLHSEREQWREHCNTATKQAGLQKKYLARRAGESPMPNAPSACPRNRSDVQ